jgi:hypothetical protein
MIQPTFRFDPGPPRQVPVVRRGGVTRWKEISTLHTITDRPRRSNPYYRGLFQIVQFSDHRSEKVLRQKSFPE